jgi:uncharacterized protein YdhG (YjbR/CyaY superfamily)
MTDTKKAAKASDGFTADERAAMKERAREAKAASSKAEGLNDLLAKIAEMPEPDRALAERVHAIVMAAAPELEPKTWYGMPAYSKDGRSICFFKPKSKFKVRYATFEFQADAALDDGSMWPVAYALTELTADAEARITALVRKAVS